MVFARSLSCLPGSVRYALLPREERIIHDDRGLGSGPKRLFPRAVLAIEEQNDQPANHRNQHQQQPPRRAIRIVNGETAPPTTVKKTNTP